MKDDERTECLKTHRTDGKAQKVQSNSEPALLFGNNGKVMGDFVGEDINFGLIIGSCIMTMPLLMTRSLSGSFWPKHRY